jgi:hypothetical protein
MYPVSGLFLSVGNKTDLRIAGAGGSTAALQKFSPPSAKRGRKKGYFIFGKVFYLHYSQMSAKTQYLIDK